MEWIKGEYSKLISFVSAGKSEKPLKQKTPSCGENKLEGDEAKLFYEEVINESPSKLSESQESMDTIKVSEEKKTIQLTEREYSADGLDMKRYLRYAQEGNIKSMKSVLDKGVPLDYSDEFGWTALMCAAHNGQMTTVKYLLSEGVDHLIRDRQGKNAADIASSNGHLKLAKYIRKCMFGSKDEPECECKHQESFYCDPCKSHFRDCSLKEHESSTVHLFNLKKKVKEDPFLLPSSNVGYKMMLRSGWDGKKGLGSEGQGQKYPVKTLLKRDRKCLGSEKSEKPKITHFNANDKKAVVKNPERKLSSRGINKKQQREKEKKRKQWERNLRMSMSVDL